MLNFCMASRAETFSVTLWHRCDRCGKTGACAYSSCHKFPWSCSRAGEVPHRATELCAEALELIIVY